jgi:hypothetical protein
MGKVTVIIESKSTSTRELEYIAHRILSSNSTTDLLPEDAETFVVPADEE